MLNHFWGLAILLAPFFYLEGLRDFMGKPAFIVDTKYPQMLLFCALAAFSCLGIHKHQVNKWIKIGLLYACVMMLFVGMDIYTFAHYKRFTITILASITIMNLSATELDNKIISKYFNAACIVACIWVFIDYFKINPRLFFLDQYEAKSLARTGGEYQAAGILEQPSLSSIHIGLLSVWTTRHKWLWVIPLIALIILKASTGAVMFASFFYFNQFFKVVKFDDRGKIKSLIPITLGLLGVFIFGAIFQGFFSDNLRLQVWAKCLEFVKGYEVIVGQGPGYFANNFTRFTFADFRFDHPHNEFLMTYSYLGIIGVGFLLKIIHELYKRCENPTVLSLLVGIVIAMNTSFIFHLAPLGLLCILIIAMIFNSRREYGFFSNKS